MDLAEIERFSRIASEWWDAGGKFAPLHKLNPTRIGYIRDRAAQHYGRDPLSAPWPAFRSSISAAAAGF